MKRIKKEEISILKAFGNKVKFERKKVNLTQKELAKKVGITHEWICKIEKGKASSVSITLMQKIGEALDMESGMMMFDDLSQHIEAGVAPKGLVAKMESKI